VGRYLGRQKSSTLKARAWLRDNGPHVCCHCGQSIDVSLPYKDDNGRVNRRCWTLEHVIPASVAPELVNEISNMREAHWECNVQRGAKPIGEVVKPIGTWDKA
jgi:5-methylcytosine-specific restriction endonuclease McrA